MFSKMAKNVFVPICIAGSLLVSASPVYSLPSVSGAPSDSDATPPPSAATNASSSTASGALTGSVATTEQTAESILVEVEQTVHHLKDASWGAFTEAQRPDVVFVGGPEVIGGMVLPAINTTGQIATGAYLPPRKKWIDYYSMHVAYLAPMLKQELESFKLPDGVSSGTQNDYREYKIISDHLPELCDKMITACQGPKYDNVTISMAAGMLHEELKRYEKVRKEIFKDIKEDFKK